MYRTGKSNPALIIHRITNGVGMILIFFQVLGGEIAMKHDLKKHRWRWVNGICPAAALLLGTMACRPVLTIGWGEMLILLVVLFLVLAPLILRVVRMVLKTGEEHPDRKKDAH